MAVKWGRVAHNELRSVVGRLGANVANDQEERGTVDSASSNVMIDGTATVVSQRAAAIFSFQLSSTNGVDWSAPPSTVVLGLGEQGT